MSRIGFKNIQVVEKEFIFSEIRLIENYIRLIENRRKIDSAEF